MGQLMDLRGLKGPIECEMFRSISQVRRKQRKIRGLKLWEYNSSKNELKEAKFRRTNVVISCLNDSYDRTETHEVIVNENCVYFQALNRKNAERKLGIK